MKAKFIFLFVFMTSFYTAMSQNDSSHTLSFSVNLLNNLFNQHTIEAEYQLTSKYTVGIGGGFVKANQWWNKDHRHYDGTDDLYPTGVYNGWLMLLNFKRLNITRNNWYFQTNLFYKYLYYDHVYFDNFFGDKEPELEWIRSEITNVFGFKLLVGKKFDISDHFAMETVFGISLRERHRAYITPWARNMDNPWGVQHLNQIFPGLQAGLLLTIGNFRIK